MKKKECVVMLLAGGQGSRLGGLTRDIAKPAVVFGGKYRIIDFALSNCYHSGFDTVGVLTQYKPLLLNSYIGTGSSWALDSVNGGVRILPPYLTRDGGNWYKGTADAIYQNIEYIDFYNPSYVLIISGDQVYKMDYSLMLEMHKDKEADVSISVIEVPWDQASRFGVMIADDDDRIIDFEEKPLAPRSNKASMGIYIFKWDVLREALIEDHNLVETSNDFGKNVIPMLLEQGKEMYTYSYKGYWRDVGTIESYYEATMDLLSKEPEMNLYDNQDFKIYSNNSNIQPHFVDANAVIKNSLICNGSTILGEVHHSVLGNDVCIGRGARVIDSVILNNTIIEDGTVIEKTIIGENIQIGRNLRIGKKGENSDIEVVFNNISTNQPY
ncbi:glucose-1-phosphate adenylyltransferase [Vallitalea okinawensis]|uniref:glucose-1-phosphate adenylyltransferase n=1 Tax=Vallitalea okinawensis TaxID=2078660 RepID=UPI000CFA927D|nr:glucose-1-phosphate adenylyltransferase [Vallitalea okinawensis]